MDEINSFFRGRGFVIGIDAGQDGFENGGVVWVASNLKHNG